jgi:hypothetical protein
MAQPRARFTGVGNALLCFSTDVPLTSVLERKRRALWLRWWIQRLATPELLARAWLN